EHDAVDALQDELSGCVVVDLPRDRIEVKAGLEASDRSEVYGEEIEKQSAFRFGRQRDQLSSRIRRDLVVTVLDVRRFPAEPRTVVHDLAIDLARGVVDHRHGRSLLTATEQ